MLYSLAGTVGECAGAQDDHAHAPLRKGGLYRQFHHVRYFPGSPGIARIFCAVSEYPVRARFLKETAAGFGPGDMGGHSKDGAAVMDAVVKAVHQM